MMKAIIASIVACAVWMLALPTAVVARTVIPLTVDAASTSAAYTGTTKVGLVNDGFAYADDGAPYDPAPNQAHGTTLYLTESGGGGTVDIDFVQVCTNIVLDLWGRSDYVGAEESRHQNLTITFYKNHDTQTHQVTGWNGVSTKSDTPASYGRYTPPADVEADRVTISHGGDYLCLAEVRAAGVAVPDGRTVIPLTVDEASTSAAYTYTTKAGLVNDGFAYTDDGTPYDPAPYQGWGANNSYTTESGGGGTVDIDFVQVCTNIVLDLWGRSDYVGAEESRHQNLTITFYKNHDTQTHQVTGWNGVSTKSDTPASYGRYTPPADVEADRVTIGHGGDYLTLAEVRAAGVGVPDGRTVIPLAVDEASTSAAYTGTTKAGLVNDGFAYAHDDGSPNDPAPNQGWSAVAANLYLTESGGGGTVDIDFVQGCTNIVLDLWGRSDYTGAEQSRHQNLTITFYKNHDTQTYQVTGWNGVSSKEESPASYGRFRPPADVEADRVTIGHGGDYLALAEVRAAGVGVPDGRTVIPLAVDEASTSAAYTGTTKAGLVNDGFAYAHDDGSPNDPAPNQGWSAVAVNLYLTESGGGGTVDIDFSRHYKNIVLDLWGRSDYADAEQSRHQNLTITFYKNHDTQTYQMTGWNGVRSTEESPASYGRFRPPAGVEANRVTISHSGDYLLLAEARAAGVILHRGTMISIY